MIKLKRFLSYCTESLRGQVKVARMPAKSTTGLLQQLRDLMNTVELVKEPLSAYIIPSRDAHNSEYTAECDQRRAFISGFDGSAGTAVVTKAHALMWTDGRYFLQAQEQMDTNWTLMKFGVAGTPTECEWINQNLPAGSYVGVDPRLYTKDEWVKLSTDLQANGNTLMSIQENLVDLIWTDKPSRPKNPVIELPLQYCGKSTVDKLVDVRKKLEEAGAQYLVVSALDEIAWLLNWRGRDIPYNPVFFAYVGVGMDGLDVFIDSDKLGPGLIDSLKANVKNTVFHPYEAIKDHLEKMVPNLTGKFMLSKYESYFLADAIPEEKRIMKLSPIALMKAIKNEVEVQGMINCHIRDAAAVCCFFGWLENALKAGEEITETSAADKLEEFRKQQKDFEGLSFPTISGSGPNGAIIHYAPDPKTCRRLSLDEVYLVDSGGQYKDGTTDITRTVHFGTPTEFQKECYTRVLKGQIELVNSIFPEKLVGNYLDSFARRALWNVGLDYLHGTGHGIGSYLNVHEGPHGISWRPYPDDPGLHENMFTSNEPGFYHENEFGIRLENIIRVVKASPKFNFSKRPSLTFQDVTLVPIHQAMIDTKLMSPIEISYLNVYHDLCRQKVGDYMVSIGITQDNPGYQWLIKETKHLPGSPGYM